MLKLMKNLYKVKGTSNEVFFNIVIIIKNIIDNVNYGDIITSHLYLSKQ